MKPITKNIPISKIKTKLDLTKIDYHKALKIAESVRENGLVEPITVRKGYNGYSIILGEIRFLAAILAGLEKIPVMILQDNKHDHIKNTIFIGDQLQTQSDIESYVQNKLRLINQTPLKPNKSKQMLLRPLTSFENSSLHKLRVSVSRRLNNTLYV